MDTEEEWQVYVAVLSDDAEALRDLLSRYPHVFLERGNHYLGVALTGKNERVAALLLEMGADINSREVTLATTYDEVATALSNAMNSNDLAEFQRLMLAHPENLRDQDGKDAWLHWAAHFGRLEFVKFLVDLGIDVNEPTDPDIGPEGAIDQAASEGHLEVVRWFLDHGAKINFEMKGYRRCMALRSAAWQGHLDIVKLLVERGADVNENWGNLTPLSYAMMYGKKQVEAYLRSVGAKEPWQLAPLQIPAGHAAILKHFTKHRGKPGPLASQEIVPCEPSIAIHVVPPSKEYDGYTLFTVGMSDKPMNLPEGRQGFAELAIYLPKSWQLTNTSLHDPNWSWPIQWLRKIALYPHETGSWPGGGSLVFANEEPPQPFAPNTKLSCILAVADPGEFGRIALPDHRSVAVYSLYAIYAEERDLEKREGTRHLIELFEKHKIPRTVDIARRNVAV